MKYKRTIFFVLTLGAASGYAAEIKPASNQEVAQTWNRSTAADMGPTLQELDEGHFVLTKSGEVSLDTYALDVTAAASTTTTANRSGNYYRLGAQTDIRRTNEKEETDYFQASLTHSKDPAVLSRTQNQINNLQFGRARESYILSGGDVAPSFSSMSSSLAARGVLGQKAFGYFLGTAYFGVIADSWESLANSTPRSNFIRDAYGAKLEKDLFEGMNFYVTTQSAKDQRDSITDPSVIGLVNAAEVSTSTIGFDYKPTGNFQLSAEVAQSKKRIDTLDDQTGKAGIVDASYRIGEVTLQGGYHDIDGLFSSLSSRVSPGIRETYVGAGWKATSWLRLDGSKREARNFYPVIGFGSETNKFTKSDSLSMVLTPLKDLSVTLQKSNSNAEDFVAAAISKNEQSGIGVKYTFFGKWICAAQASTEQVRNESSPTYNSDTEKNRFSVSRLFTGESAVVTEPTWQLDSRLELSSQHQKMISTGNTTSQQSASLAINSRLRNKVSIDASLTESGTARPSALSDLKTHAKELAVAKEFSDTAKGRLYYRNLVSNDGEFALKVEESLIGAQLSYGF